MWISASTTVSSDFFSRPSSWARLVSDQMAGSSARVETSSRRATLPSKSKIPPQLDRSRGQVGKAVGNEVDLIGFHGALVSFSGQTTQITIIEEQHPSSHMIQYQLQGGSTAKFIDRWPKHRVNAGVQGIGRAEAHGFKDGNSHWDFKFQVLFTNHALLDDAKRARERGGCNPWSPDLRLQSAGEVDAEVVGAAGILARPTTRNSSTSGVPCCATS